MVPRTCSKGRGNSRIAPTHLLDCQPDTLEPGGTRYGCCVNAEVAARWVTGGHRGIPRDCHGVCLARCSWDKPLGFSSEPWGFSRSDPERKAELNTAFQRLPNAAIPSNNHPRSRRVDSRLSHGRTTDVLPEVNDRRLIEERVGRWKQLRVIESRQDPGERGLKIGDVGRGDILP